MEKAYVDRETQTEATPQELSYNPAPAPFAKGPNPSRLRQEIPDHAPSDNPTTEFVSVLMDNIRSPTASPDASSITNPRRVYKPAPLKYNRPSGADSRVKSVDKRVVSLPETEPLCSVKNVLASVTLRVASMSERPKLDMSGLSQDPSSAESFEISCLTENSYPTEEGNFSSHSRRGLLVSDVPQTPSPPSSPDSVMIIENSIHLPRSFLGHKANGVSHHPYDDDGWITWANSPPRPIPALHGPLSLPYARCPSGAEGTIIEGQDDLPRVIWGLGPDDMQPSHPRLVSYDAQSSIVHKPTVNPLSNHNSKLQKTQAIAAHGHVTRNHRVHDVSSPCPLNERDRIQSVLQQYPLDTLGSTRFPSDTSTYADAVARKNASPACLAKDHHEIWSPVYGWHDKWTRESFDQDLRAIDVERGLGLDFHASLAQENFEPSGFRENGLKRTDYLKASAPVFVPDRQTSSYSHPRIFIEPRPNDISLPSRLSAIEIAQRYRHQRQQQNSLPTPPSSATSSSQWSPYFDSHQVSLDQATFLPPRMSATHLQQQKHHTLDLYQPLNRPVYEDRSGPAVSPSFTPSSKPITSPQVASQQLLDSLATLLQHRAEFSSPLLVSPPHPGPPPNSPLPPLPASSPKFSSPLPTIPLSPTSPESLTRTLVRRQPRSVPLARLIQRRLSSVPEEEDIPSFFEQTSSPPRSPSKTNLGNRVTLMADQIQNAVAPGTPVRDVVGGLASHSKEAEMVDRPRNAAVAPAKVKLPRGPLKSLGTTTNKPMRAAGKAKVTNGVEARDSNKVGTLPKKKVRGRKVKTAVALAEASIKN